MMDTVMDKLLSDFGMEMCREKEAKIRAALPDGLGLFDVKGRLTCVVSGEGIETYALDGEPLIQILPTRYRTRTTEDGVSVIATQQSRTF